MAKKITKKKPTASKKTAKKKSPNKPAATKPPAAIVSEAAIGETAGRIWGALEQDGQLTLASLKKASGVSADVTMMAVGWLAREAKLQFATSGRSVKVSLR